MQSILIVDNKDDENFCNIVAYLKRESIYDIHMANSYDEGVSLLSNESYDFIVIDFAIDFGNQLLLFILKKYPKQKIITLSKKIAYSDILGCQHCQYSYLKKRLMKPADFSDFYTTLQNFDSHQCIYMDNLHTPEGLIKVFDKIVKRFPQVNYDSKHKIMTLKNSLHIAEISSFLLQNNIAFEYKEDTITLLG